MEVRDPTADADMRLLDQKEAVGLELARLASDPAVTRYLDVKEMQHAWEALLSRRAHPITAASLLRGINTAHFLLSEAQCPTQGVPVLER